jgi:hypothetical protein
MVDMADIGWKMYYMNLAIGRVLKTGAAGAAAQYARSFYLLLGNRRKYERTPISGTVRVICPGYDVESVYVSSCVDISPRGMAIDCPEQIAPDTFVTLQVEHGTKRLARVAYCRQSDTACRIGLEFTALKS